MSTEQVVTVENVLPPALPEILGRPYFHDRENFKYGLLIIYWRGVTPKGKFSKHWHYVLIRRNREYANLTVAEAFVEALKQSPEAFGNRYNLPKGYHWEMFTHTNYWK